MENGSSETVPPSKTVAAKPWQLGAARTRQGCRQSSAFALEFVQLSAGDPIWRLADPRKALSATSSRTRINNLDATSY